MPIISAFQRFLVKDTSGKGIQDTCLGTAILALLLFFGE